MFAQLRYASVIVRPPAMDRRRLRVWERCMWPWSGRILDRDLDSRVLRPCADCLFDARLAGDRPTRAQCASEAHSACELARGESRGERGLELALIRSLGERLSETTHP